MRIVAAIALSLLALPALAQRTIQFSANTTTGDGQVVPVLTWSTSPPAQSCTASGQWEGEKPPSGTETLPPITSSATYNLSCTWPGDSIATLSWSLPTTNCNGSPVTDLASVVIRYAFEADPTLGHSGAPCSIAHPLEEVMTAPPTGGVVLHEDLDVEMRTITGLTQVGEYRFSAHVCNSRGICSGPSNLAAKTFTGAVTAVESVGIQVNPVPAPIVDLAVQ